MRKLSPSPRQIIHTKIKVFDTIPQKQRAGHQNVKSAGGKKSQSRKTGKRGSGNR